MFLLNILHLNILHLKEVLFVLFALIDGAVTIFCTTTFSKVHSNFLKKLWNKLLFFNCIMWVLKELTLRKIHSYKVEERKRQRLFSLWRLLLFYEIRPRQHGLAGPLSLSLLHTPDLHATWLYFYHLWFFLVGGWKIWVRTFSWM